MLELLIVLTTLLLAALILRKPSPAGAAVDAHVAQHDDPNER